MLDRLQRTGRVVMVFGLLRCIASKEYVLVYWLQRCRPFTPKQKYCLDPRSLAILYAPSLFICSERMDMAERKG